MIGHNFDIFGCSIDPNETNPPFVVDSDAVLSLPISRQRFEMVVRRAAQILQPLGGIDHVELAQRDSAKTLKAANEFTAMERFAIPITKASDHAAKDITSCISLQALWGLKESCKDRYRPEPARGSEPPSGSASRRSGAGPRCRGGSSAAAVRGAGERARCLPDLARLNRFDLRPKQRHRRLHRQFPGLHCPEQIERRHRAMRLIDDSGIAPGDRRLSFAKGGVAQSRQRNPSYRSTNTAYTGLARQPVQMRKATCQKRIFQRLRPIWENRSQARISHRLPNSG